MASSGAGATRILAGSTQTGDSLLSRMLFSWTDMPGQVGKLLRERTSEQRLFLFVILSDLVFVLSLCVKTLVSPTIETSAISGASGPLYLLMAVILRTSIIYTLAGALAAGMRLIGGKGSFQATRIGVFWGALVAAPFGLAVSEFGVLIDRLQYNVPMLQYAGIQMIPVWLGMVPFVWFVAKGIAAANKIQNVAPLFATLSGLGVIGAYLFKLLAS